MGMDSHERWNLNIYVITLTLASLMFLMAVQPSVAQESSSFADAILNAVSSPDEPADRGNQRVPRKTVKRAGTAAVAHPAAHAAVVRPAVVRPAVPHPAAHHTGAAHSLIHSTAVRSAQSAEHSVAADPAAVNSAVHIQPAVTASTDPPSGPGPEPAAEPAAQSEHSSVNPHHPIAPCVSPSAKSADEPNPAGAFIDLDSLQETKPEKKDARSNPIINAAIRGGIIGGIAGLVTAGVVWLIAMLTGMGRDGDSQDSRRGTVVSAITIPITMFFMVNSNVADSLFPFLKTIAPANTRFHSNDSGPMHFAPVRSQSFLFQCSMPQPMTMERQKMQNIWGTTITHKEKNGALAVLYGRLPTLEEMAEMLPPMQKAQLKVYGTQLYYDDQKGLDAAVENSVQKMNGTITYKQNTLLDNRFAGRDVEGTVRVEGHDGIFREQAYIVNKGFYVLLVVGEKAFVKSLDAQRFFDSFRVLTATR